MLFRSFSLSSSYINVFAPNIREDSVGLTIINKRGSGDGGRYVNVNFDGVGVDDPNGLGNSWTLDTGYRVRWVSLPTNDGDSHGYGNSWYMTDRLEPT